MSVEAARPVIQQYFNSNWTGTPASTVALDNVPFTKPNEAPWIRLSINQAAPNQQASIGGITNRYRRFGLVSIQVFTVLGTGPKISGLLVDEAVNLFEVIVGGPSKHRLAGPPSILFGNVNSNRIGRTPDGAWYQYNVGAFFQFDDLK